MLAGLIVHVRPDGEMLVARLTVPVKPPTGDTVRVELPVVPAFMMRLVGLAVSVKSWTVTVIVVECVLVPL